MLSCSVMSDPLQSHGQAPRSIVVLQARMLEWVAMPSSRGSSTQGLNPGLPHCRWILYHVSHQGSPRILEWVVYPFSRGSSHPRNQTGISCIAGGFFISLANREAPLKFLHLKNFFGHSQMKFSSWMFCSYSKWSALNFLVLFPLATLTSQSKN